MNVSTDIQRTKYTAVSTKVSPTWCMVYAVTSWGSLQHRISINQSAINGGTIGSPGSMLQDSVCQLHNVNTTVEPSQLPAPSASTVYRVIQLSHPSPVPAQLCYMTETRHVFSPSIPSHCTVENQVYITMHWNALVLFPTMQNVNVWQQVFVPSSWSWFTKRWETE